MKKLALIVAVSDNGVIGVNGQLPWHIPEDLKYFKANTTGHAIIMGRKTFDSIGRPLPKRRNIVVTRNPDLEIEGVEVVNSLQAAIALARTDDEEPRIIGGSSLYDEAMPQVTTMFLTRVHREVEGDTFFPAYDETQWRVTASTPADGYTFLTLERKESNQS